MIFDDNFIQLTGAGSLNTKKSSDNPETDEIDALETESFGEPSFTSSVRYDDNQSTEYGNSSGDYVIESDLVTPSVKAVHGERPLIVVVDDDFETLDLLEIYLQRNYEYVSFSGPREAIFFLNQRVPDLIIIDCKIHTMKANTFAEIIRHGAGKEDVPFVYMGTDEELATIDNDYIPEYIVGCLKRPVARGDLQGLIDRALKKKKID